MPAMHCCFGRQFLSIMEGRRIIPGRFDEVIRQNAAFFFYGKPAYKPRNDGKSSDTIWSALYAFILDYDSLPQATSALPFDSGGYEKFYSDICDGAAIDEYYLEDPRHSPAKLVSAFFGDNTNYYDMMLRGDLSSKLSKLDFHSDSLRAICSPNNRTAYDQRAACIELHFKDRVELNRGNLLAVVGPSTALDETEVLDFAGDLGADLVPYDLDLDDVSARLRQVRDATKAWLKGKGYLA